jgi:hypothetical protein
VSAEGVVSTRVIGAGTGDDRGGLAAQQDNKGGRVTGDGASGCRRRCEEVVDGNAKKRESHVTLAATEGVRTLRQRATTGNGDEGQLG